MPIVHIQILEGRTTEQKRALVERVTTAVSETINSPAERVSVVIDEMKTENFAVGGVLQSDK
ncbi:2-hydroxymuconate tautomerase [Shouchella patagoniensis]|uniref:2-hydroxymuconate tautomerase n=1 Tax=Shouchella patagoniensis TaxID=228576 RepID=UPI00099515D8|nr:2-hydroxymuconate tautomerase [Shouchella patagoniensis]